MKGPIAPKKFRITLTKRTVAAYSVGYGHTREEALREATKFFRRDIYRGKPDRIYVERWKERSYVEVECLEAVRGGYVGGYVKEGRRR